MEVIAVVEVLMVTAEVALVCVSDGGRSIGGGGSSNSVGDGSDSGIGGDSGSNGGGGTHSIWSSKRLLFC